MASLTTAGLFIAATLGCVVYVGGDPQVDKVQPGSGSVAGGTRLTITGSEFSPDPFNFGEGNIHKGNRVVLLNSFFSVVCDVIPYLSNEEKIVCDTRPLRKEGSFSIHVIVDGVPVEQYCKNCDFEYRDRYTPTITSVTPPSGPPGTKLSIRGKIFTDVYDPSKALEDEDDNYEGKRQIQRIYWGNYACDPINPVTEEFYNIALDSSTSENGVIECVPKGTFIASQTVSYLISDEYGRSAIDKDILKVSGQNHLYVFQTHADVLDVSPKLGSIEGGTVLIITGRHFDELNTTVLVGGVPCEIFNITTTKILCKTGPALPQQDAYQGERGLLYEVLEDPSDEENLNWDPNAAGYNSTIVPEARSSQEIVADGGSFASRLTGFFVPPYNGPYEFHVRGDGLVGLWMSTNNSSSNLTRIAYVPQYYTKVTERLYLSGNQTYYLEARNDGNDPIELGVAMFHVPLNRANLSAATNEVQDITTTSTVNREMQTLTVPEPIEFALEYDGVASSPLSWQSSAEQVQNALLEMFSVKCQTIGRPRGYYIQDYEQNDLGYIRGQVINDQEPYCGRWSVRNPDRIFSARRTLVPDTRNTIESFDITQHDKLCFGHRGAIQPRIQFLIIWTDERYKSRRNWQTFNSVTEFEVSDNWVYTCLDIHALVKPGWIYRDHLPGSPFLIEVIRLFREDGNDMYIDNLYIGNGLPQYQRVQRAASPNDIFVLDASVTKTNSSFDITLTPAKCGHRFPLLGVKDANMSMDSNRSHASYWSEMWPTDDVITIQRQVSATPPIGGMFEVELYGVTFNVSAQARADQLKEALQAHLDIGALEVTREGSCSGWSWEIEWLSKGGSQPLIQVNGSGLRGFEVDVSTRQIEEGHILLTPIPGEFLRVPHLQPQVEVIVNNIPSSCSSNQCSYEYSDVATPKIFSSAPASGSAYNDTILRLSGSGFSSNSSKNNVTIAGVVCNVTFVNETTIFCAVGEASGGLYDVILEVDGTGKAYYPNGPITFQYQLGITDITPKAGSTAGGTKVTITGYGFGSNGTTLQISFGDKPCHINSITHEEIQCVIGMDTQVSKRKRRSTLYVDLIIIKDGETVKKGDAFNFDPSLTPTILEISPNVSSIHGGGVLVISGSGFGNSSAKVTIGDALCWVIGQTDDEITCTIPGHAPGKFYVLLTVEGQGFAEANGMKFQYKLDVTGMSPDQGSLQGGTVLTITGAGFGTDIGNVNVHLGYIDCNVTSVTNDTIQCVTNSTQYRHYVSNFGKHELYGLGYKWSPQVLTITAGDTVVWEWGTQQFVTGIGYAVRQTADEFATMYDGQGFNSGESTPNGIFAHKFDKPGIYYYSSGPVDDDETLYMQGTVIVKKPNSMLHKLSVRVGNYEALHDTDSGVSAPVSSENCSGIETPIPGCTIPPAKEPDTSSFYFNYWFCSTPRINGVSPNMGTPDQVINITGSGFSDVPCHNEIKFGKYYCIPQTATNDTITCLLDTANSMPVGQPRRLSVLVKNRGHALNQIPKPVYSHFTLIPQIDALSTHSGSLLGGTEIIISGEGFASAAVSVRIGDYGCIVQSHSYTQVVCVTTPANAGLAELKLSVDLQAAVCNDDCSFEFLEALTPVVENISPNSISGSSAGVTIQGWGFGNVTSDVNVTIGGIACLVMSANDTEIGCHVGYIPVGDRKVVVNIAGKGNAFFNTSDIVTSEPLIYSVTPDSGSTAGGQSVTISGSGFIEWETTVDIGGSACIVQSVTLSEVVCVTSDHAAGVVDLVVTSGGVGYPSRTYEYTADLTPTINSVTPNTGVTGDNIIIDGSGFSSEITDVIVSIDNVNCTVTSAANDSIECTLGAHSAGTYVLVVYIRGKGLSDSNTMFKYTLSVTSVSPIEGSFGGGRMLSIVGAGFDETAIVMVCNNTCPISNVMTSFIECETPANSGSGDVVCDVTVTLASGASATASDAFTYRSSLTPVIDSVEPRRGGTAGGTMVNITGSGFLSSGNVVTIGGSNCTVQTESPTEIVCETGPHSPPEMTKVRVKVRNNGIATQDNADFYYIDVWSSRYTWGNQDPPREGEFVIIPAGQILLLDVTTPILKMLLIQGGSVIFDEADIELHAENILIVDGGLLQVGTEDEPFQHEATIMMHGHVRSIELPLFGAKTLAVRNGTLDLHGKPVPVTWTRLAETASAGNTTMILERAVTWKMGDQIVIASTGHRHSQRENELLTITGVSADGRTLDFEPALAYDHLGITQMIEGVTLEMRAEVGLLTRNVKFRGSVQEEWTETYDACPREFDTNQFATQTCFLGRFGEETGSDQFGAQIMLFAKYQDRQLVKGRIEYVEVTHAGQAFRLGRYPIHFHLNGNVNGSYVRGCGIHHTFNRAVTIHAVHNLLVEYNVAYNIMGHAYFLEDGIETGNIIQYNLGVFVRPSSSLLNVDITPATFWVTNPDNIVRHNAAAGGSHFGFWYNMPKHPGGPSFTTSICPRNVPLGEFRNNTAHAQGWYGIWIFPEYTPKVGGGCHASRDEPAKFYSLYAWEIERGAEAVVAGAIQFHDFVISDADKAGVEYQTVGASWGGSVVSNLVVVAYSSISESNKESECTEAGVQAPKADGLTVTGATFINFDQLRCAAIRACAHCKTDQGGFSTRFEGLDFRNSPNKAAFKWEHECWLEDLDGSLTGSPNYIVLPNNPNLPPNHCSQDPAYSVGMPGSHCDTTVRLHRLAFNSPSPSSLLYKDTLFTNEHGTSRINYHKKRITHPFGWMITLIDGDNYNFIFENVDHVTNISYDARFDNFGDSDFVLINHNFTQRPDKFATIGVIQNSTEYVPTYDDNENGDWHFENDTRLLTYIVSGKGESEPVNRDIDLDVYQCYFLDCLPPVPEIPKPPPEGRPGDARLWSDSASWSDVEPGWSGHLDGPVHDVMIMPSVWMLADVQLPAMNKLFIYGTLEIEDTQDNQLEATYILIQGGRLIVGFSEDKPFQHEMKILLNGHHFTPDLPLPRGPNLGSKALGVFGGLELHGRNHSVYWTQLERTVNAGDSMLTVVDGTDWMAGDEIVVATTSYEAWQTETFRIEEVIDAFTFRLNQSFVFKHIAERTSDYVLAAEVGLLTRSIKIEGNDYNLLYDESYGARVLVGQLYQDGVQYKGYARISNVEFYHSGQEGWSDFFDPRYSLAFLNVGEVTDDSPSAVHGCSFHNGFSPAIGVFGTNGLKLQDNVIHHTVGPGIIVWDENNQLIHNLVTLVVFPGTYQDRFEGENLMWNAGIEIEQAGKVILRDNTVAGSERVAFKIKGESCYDPVNPDTDWSGNVGHSTLHGIHVFLEAYPDCTRISNFLIYKSWDYGIYHQSTSRVLIQNVKLVDNKVGILPIVFLPSALAHRTSDKFVRIEDSLIVGVSDSFDCIADNVQPENAGQSQKHRPPRPPGGGHVGLMWPTFNSGFNGAPFMVFNGAHSYPSINGITEIDNVVFRSFNDHCGKQDAMIMTNPAGEDALHPIHVKKITLEDVDSARKVFIHWPNLGSVNPSDCVDMDCDGLKKAMIRDLDGSLLGSIGTVIPQSEFEWNGDARRGLGDYRIPKVMLTTPDGSKIPADDKAPNKGIFRGHNNECAFNLDWQAYECHGIDHMMLVVESMDADTEVRRLTPLAMYTDTYVDLINGPQDHGWCHGYTCQERISTLYTLVATGKDYEVYFTSTNPQVLRLHLLNSDDSQAVVLGIWYANPQRLDVYYQNKYVSPNNADFSSGELIWKAKNPTLLSNQYHPSVNSGVYGENYFERDTQTLWLLVKGPEPVEIRTTAVLMVTFGVPAVAVDDFFETNLVANLAALLNIDKSRIRIVSVVRESSGRRRRAADEAEVMIEVSSPPEPTIESPGSDIGNLTSSDTTTAAPPSGTTPIPGTSNYDELLDVQAKLAESQQTGSLGDALNTTISSMSMTDPVPEPTDPTGGVRATNVTGGTDDVPDGTKTIAQLMQEMAENANVQLEVQYLTPDRLVLHTQPNGAIEGAVFGQLALYAVDAAGTMLPRLGSATKPWELTVLINPSTPNADTVQLSGNTTVAFDGSWANFTDLTIDHSASGVILDFQITHPNTSRLAAISSSSFNVDVRPYELVIVTSPSSPVNEKAVFGVTVELRDAISHMFPYNLLNKSLEWYAAIELSMPTNYKGQLRGQFMTTFDLQTATAHFTDLSIDARGVSYILRVDVTTQPSSTYQLSVLVNPFDVTVGDPVIYEGPTKRLKLRFDVDYDVVVAGNEEMLKINFLNNIVYPNVTISNVIIERGSVVILFDMQGAVDTAITELWSDVEGGHFTLNFNGQTLDAESYLLVDGDEYEAPTTAAPPGGFPIWAIALIAVIILVIGLIMTLIILNFLCKRGGKKENRVESQLLGQETLGMKDINGSGSLENPLLKLHESEGIPFEYNPIKDGSPNTPRRTPEVEVQALPPGFTEVSGQEERLLDERVSMMIMVRNQDDAFQKLGKVNANKVGTLRALRDDVKMALPGKLQEKKFILIDETLKDMDGAREKKTMLSEVYHSDCILIRWVEERDIAKLCVCGLVGQFECSLCHQQTYCSPQCQSTDWVRHSMQCSSYAVASVDNSRV